MVNCLPIVHRELQVAARRGATYRQRFIVGAIASAVVIVFTIFAPHISSRSGHGLFQMVATGGLIICLLQGLRETADALAQERREGTLGLLFLTDLRGYDVVFGKITAGSIKSFSILLAMLPAFAFPIWLGGVTIGEFWRVALTLVCALVLAMTVGIVISARAESAVSSALGAIALLVLMVVVPWINNIANGPLPHWIAGPIAMFASASDVTFLSSSELYWKGFGWCISVAITFFVIASVLVNKLQQQERTGERLWDKLMQPAAGYSQTWGGGSGQQDPSTWLGERMLPARKILWMLIAGGGVISFISGCVGGPSAVWVAVGLQLIVGFIIKLWAAMLSCQPFHAARRIGAFELLLCTPIRAADLVRGHIDALRGYFMGPLITAALTMVPAAALGSLLAVHSSNRPEQFFFSAIVSGGWFLIALLDINALIYVGLWLGLTEQQLQNAISKTVVRVLLLPWLVMLVPCVGVMGIIAIPAIVMSTASGNLARRFTTEARSQFSVEKDDGWLKWFRRKSVPPRLPLPH